jgi:hypothetical protein
VRKRSDWDASQPRVEPFLGAFMRPQFRERFRSGHYRGAVPAGKDEAPLFQARAMTGGPQRSTTASR